VHCLSQAKKLLILLSGTVLHREESLIFSSIFLTGSVADPGCLSRIPDPDFCPSRITDPGSRIPDLGSRIPDPKTATKERGEKKFDVIPFCVATNFSKLYIILVLKCRRKKKKNWANFQRIIELFILPKKLSLNSQTYGFGIRDPGSGKNLFQIPDPGVKKALDPGSGSATLLTGQKSCRSHQKQRCILKLLICV
jgi:hypothetical protein